MYNNTLKQLKTEWIFLFFSGFFSFILSLYRVYATKSFYYVFLNWNLFLALIPFIITSFLLYKKVDLLKKRYALILIGIWLLFFPNAPYLFTDLFHFKFKNGMPLWYDLVMILSYAWTGMMAGLFSLKHIETLISNKISSKYISIISSFLLYVTAFGVYLGRYLRWNSWDIIHRFDALFIDILDRVVFPLDHPKTWGMTLLMGTFLNIIYWSFKIIRPQEHKLTTKFSS